MNVRTLYLCYFGLREPLVQTQVLPYLRELGKGGIEVFLLTFEQECGSETERLAWKGQLAGEGIIWHYLRYHRRPSLPATLYDILAGAWMAVQLVQREKITVLHARSHVAAMMGALAKRWCNAKLVFDIRGVLAEEYVDAGIWPAGGLLYRLTKAAERWLLKTSDAFVVLTEKGRALLFADHPALVEVIPCCVDAERFRLAGARAATRRDLGLTNQRVLVYVGALGGWYLTDEMAEFLALAHAQAAPTFSLILTQSPPERLTAKLEQLGVPPEQFSVRFVAPVDIPRYLAAADVALSFIKPCYSKQFSSPTKVGEYLAAGLPVIFNAGVGDLDDLLVRANVGIRLSEFNQESYREALQTVEQLLAETGTAARCQAVAQNQFDLVNVGGVRYRRLYQRLLASAQK